MRPLDCPEMAPETAPETVRCRARQLLVLEVAMLRSRRSHPTCRARSGCSAARGTSRRKSRGPPPRTRRGAAASPTGVNAASTRAASGAPSPPRTPTMRAPCARAAAAAASEGRARGEHARRDVLRRERLVSNSCAQSSMSPTDCAVCRDSLKRPSIISLRPVRSRH
ncbi:hypothetical protein M885DRAFT_332572 [Pelagophyceae sp. CCMP2097]|nr:hypothetical protein M885DRAFT_332572 [Pelagophyceae sp. CCMP2097]